jgi:hypothetical protein
VVDGLKGFLLIFLKKLTIFLLLTSTLIYAKGGIDIAKVIKPSFSQGATVSKKQFKLSAKEMKAVQKSAKARLDFNVIRMYTVSKGKKVEGYGVLLVQTIRTKKAAILYIIDNTQTIKAIEILAFNEPSEYKPNKTWQAVFEGKTKEDNLFSGKGIPTISGATLSARAISDAARLALSIVEMYK